MGGKDNHLGILQVYKPKKVMYNGLKADKVIRASYRQFTTWLGQLLWGTF